ncbi:MAG: glycosyltransferase [Chthoniobacterales bacterium]|nr:glycosyltransferase [Chthoniobacterales bacterium]
MKLVVFGLAISSSWGNGHATLLRALFRELTARGHHIVFFERDVQYYSFSRDLHQLPGGKLIFYTSWEEVLTTARHELSDADAAMVMSYCPDGIAATELLRASSALRLFYDMDTPVTLAKVRAGERLSYIGPRGLSDFDLVLSFTGGAALTALQEDLGARKVAPLYGWVDPEVHHPVAPNEQYRASFSYLGTYAADRQVALERLFIEPARRLPQERFSIGGAQYPPEFPWAPNIYFHRHVAPAEHPAFFCSSRLTLNLTREPMREMGWCPPGRMFEASACGAPLVSDVWEGIEDFFTPGEEILLVRTTDDAVNATRLTDAELTRIGRAGRERTLAEHSVSRRATEFEDLLVTAGGEAVAA